VVVSAVAVPVRSLQTQPSPVRRASDIALSNSVARESHSKKALCFRHPLEDHFRLRDVAFRPDRRSPYYHANAAGPIAVIPVIFSAISMVSRDRARFF